MDTFKAGEFCILLCFSGHLPEFKSIVHIHTLNAECKMKADILIASLRADFCKNHLELQMESNHENLPKDLKFQ